MKLGELKGRAVLAIEDARKLGKVDDVLVDPADWRMVALRVKPAAGGPDCVVACEDIRSIGTDAVTVATIDALRPIDRAPDIAGLPSLNGMLNKKVISEGGAVLGTIGAVEIDTDARRVQAFEYGAGALASMLGRQHRLDPSRIVAVGPRLVTVREEAGRAREAGA